MKVDRTGPIRSSPVRRGEKSGKTKTGAFAKHVESTPEPASGVSGGGPVASVDALLAIQEVEDSTSGRSRARARQWGEETLDRLERLRIGILSGGIPVDELQRIAQLTGAQRVRTDDPKLAELLAEIELRARVELAKYAPRG